MRFHTALVIALLLGVQLHAHHSGIMFDPVKQVTLKGTIKEFVFTNPHVTILITVTDDKGQAVDWSIEAASTQALVRSGWRRSSLKFGDSVTIVGRPLKDGRPGAVLVHLTLADGTELGRSGANF
jgi:Family of unknown function (DUF6152)